MHFSIALNALSPPNMRIPLLSRTFDLVLRDKMQKNQRNSEKRAQLREVPSVRTLSGDLQ